jgi:hypothetical protein
LRKDWALGGSLVPLVAEPVDRLAGRPNTLEDLAVEVVKFPFGRIKPNAAALGDDDAGRQIGALDYESISHLTLPSACAAVSAGRRRSDACKVRAGFHRHRVSDGRAFEKET